MASGQSPKGTESEVRRSMLKLWVISTLVGVALLALALKLMGPAPPKHIRLGAGPAEGEYTRHAEAYAAYLRTQGIGVDVVETAGSVENLERLGSGDLDVALVQGGTATPDQRDALVSIASVFYEPLWIFHRKAADIASLRDLEGRRVGIGKKGSGTRDLALRILKAVDLIQDPAAPLPETLRSIGGAAAARALLAGEMDAAFFVVAPGPDYLVALLASPDVEALQLARTEAIAHRYPFLTSVRIPEGLLDLKNDLPRRTLDLIAPTAALVAGKDIHPALAALLVQAAKHVHGTGSMLAKPGTFPSPHYVDVPLSDDARRALERGPSWLYRVFPFSLASFFDRAIVLLIPLLTLLIPLMKTAPPIYRWGVRRRIYLWYRDVRKIDQAVRKRASRAELEEAWDKLQRIEKEVENVSIPLSYMREFYDLRLHLAFVGSHLRDALAEM